MSNKYIVICLVCTISSVSLLLTIGEKVFVSEGEYKIVDTGLWAKSSGTEVRWIGEDKILFEGVGSELFPQMDFEKDEYVVAKYDINTEEIYYFARDLKVWCASDHEIIFSYVDELEARGSVNEQLKKYSISFVDTDYFDRSAVSALFNVDDLYLLRTRGSCRYLKRGVDGGGSFFEFSLPEFGYSMRGHSVKRANGSDVYRLSSYGLRESMSYHVPGHIGLTGFGFLDRYSKSQDAYLFWVPQGVNKERYAGPALKWLVPDGTLRKTHVPDELGFFYYQSWWVKGGMILSGSDHRKKRPHPENDGLFYWALNGEFSKMVLGGAFIGDVSDSECRFAFVSKGSPENSYRSTLQYVEFC